MLVNTYRVTDNGLSVPARRGWTLESLGLPLAEYARVEALLETYGLAYTNATPDIEIRRA